jgi:hypothetical protein
MKLEHQFKISQDVKTLPKTPFIVGSKNMAACKYPKPNDSEIWNRRILDSNGYSQKLNSIRPH